VVAGGLLAAAASTIVAAGLAPPLTAADRCNLPQAQPFLRWLDPANYVLAPGGAIESGSNAWRLFGGAMIVAGNEPWYVHSSTDRESLRLPSGAWAITNLVCLGLTDPTLRFFAVNTGAPDVALRIVVYFRSGTGTLLGSAPVSDLLASDIWAPTAPIPLLANATVPVGTACVQFRFTPIGTDSGWRIDDVYVDPWSSR